MPTDGLCFGLEHIVKNGEEWKREMRKSDKQTNKPKRNQAHTSSNSSNVRVWVFLFDKDFVVIVAVVAHFNANNRLMLRSIVDKH